MVRRLVPLFLVLAAGTMACAGTQALGTTLPTQTSEASQAPPTKVPESAAAPTVGPTVVGVPLPGGTAVSVPLPTVAPGPTASPLSPGLTEPRWVWLEVPVRLRAGSSQVIRLSLTVEGDGAAATPEVEGSQVAGEPIAIPDVYATHNVVALASLHAAGLAVSPGEEIAEPLLPGEGVTFRWSVSAPRAGEHQIVISLRLRFIPKAGGEPVERTIWARVLTLEARSLLGLSGPAAGWLGSAGSVVGSVLSFPFFKELVLWLRRKLLRAET